jgi:DNA-binding CsgD family transcriptional regulator
MMHVHHRKEAAARKAALHDMALVVAVVSKTPGAATRGADFWQAVRDEVCARHGVSELSARSTVVLAPPPPPPLLTENQLEVLRLTAEGLTIHQIGKELVCSHHSVKSALKRVYRALEARNAAHAVMTAVRLGLLQTEVKQGSTDECSHMHCDWIKDEERYDCEVY